MFRLVRAQPDGEAAWRKLFLSWVCGGIFAADALLGVQQFGSLWHRTLEETLGITRIFTLAMVSRWAFWRWRELEDPALQANLQNAGRDVIGFFAGANESTFSDFLISTAQLFADSDEVENPLIETDFVLALAARELGVPLPVALSQLTPPVDYYRLVSTGWKPFFTTSSGMTQAHLLLSAAERSMFRLYDGWANVEI